ncbi:MAG: bifunctional heptose 7-phosphate kinase/heptose 1-phosphate adenyltransferase [Chloroflexia bacterium]|nr:bifunctional heptose 7-phosphate kinase/heptose 1-phosphate adenyltransferase [Chloroflexia bacterium]
MLDSYLEGVATRLCTEGPVPVVRKASVERSPGGAANVAANLAALGADVRFVGLVGADEAGAALRGALRERGVDDRWLVEDPAVSTIHKLRVIANDQYVVRFDEGETRDASLEARSRLLAAVEDGFAACDLVVASDYGYGVLSDGVIGRLRRLRERRPCILAIDAKEIGRYATAGATVVTPNLSEARLAVDPGTQIEPSAAATDGESIARRLHAKLDAENVVVTMAGDGVILVEAGGRVSHLPAFPVARAGDVGAGDTFTAAMALALASGAGPRLAARIGMDAAAIAITQRRTSVVPLRELLRRASLDAQRLPVELTELLGLLDRERWAGKTVVFTNGVFDILHAGHVQLLKRAKRFGDLLVVGVNSDASTRRLKGPTRPINREADRLALVAALDPVDFAVLFEEDTPEATIRAVRPHVHVKGGDYTPQSLPEREACEAVGARIEILSLVAGRSTTGVIDKIVSLVHDGALGTAP